MVEQEQSFPSLDVVILLLHHASVFISGFSKVLAEGMKIAKLRIVTEIIRTAYVMLERGRHGS